MALFKGDMGIAKEYSKLAEDSDNAEKIYNMIATEYNKTREQVLEIMELNTLMEDTPSLALSLIRRNPYLDPLNHIQISLHQRFIKSANKKPSVRQDISQDEIMEQWMQPLLRTINAISNGMRNTG